MCDHCFSYGLLVLYLQVQCNCIGLLVLYLHLQVMIGLQMPDLQLAFRCPMPFQTDHHLVTSMSLCEPDLQPLVFN